MIGQMAVRVTADRANFPLGTLFVRRGSAANVALVGVPVRAGVDVESVTVRVENVDGETADFAARQFGGVWVVDLPAAHFTTVGSVMGGVVVFATGTGADGETSRTWNIGVGDLEVLSADADAPVPTPGQAFWPLRMFDAAPTAPTKYNAYIDGSELKIWNGTAWVTISGGSGDTVDDTVTRTSANPVKSSGIWGAIWGALTALPTGFTALYDWVVAQLAGKLGTSGQQQLNGALIVYSGTSITVIEGSRIQNFAGAIAKEFSFPSASGTLAITAGTGHDGNIALLDDNGNPTDSQIPVAGIALSADLRYRIAEAEYSASVGTDGGYILADRAVNLITATDETSIDIELPDAVTVDGVRYCRDFLLDVDNSANASDLALEFTGLGVTTGDGYAFVTDAEDSIGEMMNVAKSTRARFYFTETPYVDFGNTMPVFHVARVTLGDFVTSTTTQGGN